MKAKAKGVGKAPAPDANISWLDEKSIREPLNILRTVDEDSPKFLSLVQSMIDFGFNPAEPLDVCPAPDSGFLIKDGCHRLGAARKAGIRRVPAVVGKAIPEDDILEVSVRANATVIPTAPVQYGKALGYLRETKYKGDTFVDTAKRVSKPVEWVKKMLGIGKLEGKAGDLVNKRTISIEAGLGLVKLQRAGVILTDALLARAKKEPASDFLADVDALLKRKKDKAGPVFKLRPIEDVKDALKRARKDKSFSADYVEALEWVLRQDPASLAEQETR